MGFFKRLFFRKPNVYIDVTIKPGMMPMDRGDIEDELMDRLGGDADPVGGGTMMGEDSASDFQMEVSTRTDEEVTAICVEFFESIEFALPTTVELSVNHEDIPITTKHFSE